MLTRGPVVPVGTSPSALAISPNGGFLYVANASTVSGFAICNQIVTSCNDPNAPDGILAPITGSPFSAGLGPTSIVAAPSGKFMFVVDRLSNQISEYKIATGTGELTPNTQATISTGANPVSAAIRVSTTADATTGGTANYLYVAELGSSSLSIYTFDSTKGTLGRVGAPITIDWGSALGAGGGVERSPGPASLVLNQICHPDRSAAQQAQWRDLLWRRWSEQSQVASLRRGLAIYHAGEKDVSGDCLGQLVVLPPALKVLAACKAGPSTALAALRCAPVGMITVYFLARLKEERRKISQIVTPHHPHVHARSLDRRRFQAFLF